MQASSSSLNLSVLQRLDPNIAEVVDTVAHVTIYTFLHKEQTWVRLLVH